MKKITATIVKEWLLMRRDISGLVLLLVMPAALIIVMALIQDAPFKDYQELRFDMLLADNDHGALAMQITNGLKHSKNFHVTDSINGQPVTEAQLKELLNKGDYKLGIVIPAGVTAEIVNSANIVVNDISKRAGITTMMPTREMRGQMYVHLYFDPVSKPSFRTPIGAALDKYITFASTNILMQRLSMLSKDTTATGSTDKDDLRKIMQGLSLKEEPLNDKGSLLLHINSVQHNVPAWAIFGIFFIVVPIAGHLIREREDGSAYRIALIPGAARYVTIGKIFFYTFIGTFQFVIMLALGLWGMPFFGLPTLYPGLHPWVLLPVALCIAFTATTYGIFTGSVFKTITQALPFGSVSVVILSAIGGIWIPVEILPAGMQRLALVSPMHWSLNAVNQVIIRNGDLHSVSPSLTILVSSGVLLWVAGEIVVRHQRNSL